VIKKKKKEEERIIAREANRVIIELIYRWP